MLELRYWFCFGYGCTAPSCSAAVARLRNKFGFAKKVCGWERSLKLKVGADHQKCKYSSTEVITAHLGTFKGFDKSEGRSVAALATAELQLQCDEALISATAEEDMSCVRAGRDTSFSSDIEPFLNLFSIVSVEDCLLNFGNFRLTQLQKVRRSDMSTLLGNRFCVLDSLQNEGMLVDSDTATSRIGRQVDCRGMEAEKKLTNTVELGCGQGDSQNIGLKEKRTAVVKSVRRKERQLKRRRMGKIKEKGSLVCSTASAERNRKRSHLTTLRHESANPFTKYLLYIGKKDLLTTEDEVDLAKQVQDLLKIEKVKYHLAARLGQEPTFREWSDALGIKLAVFQRRLWVARKAKFRMINSNLRLVVAIAKNYQGQGVPFQDLLQEGTKGLMHAVENFDASLGYRFSTYAHWGIKRAVTLAAARQSKSARIPMNAVEALYRVNQASMSFLEKHGRPATEDEIAQLARITVHKLRMIRNFLGSTKSFESSPGRDGVINLAETMADESSGSSEGLGYRDSFKEYLEEALCCLSERERDVLRLRFGVDTGKMLTLEEIGESLNLTRERVRQLEQRAMMKLKNSHKTTLLKNFVQHIEI
ncbi:hypothetical protein O6H91_05G076400 [Diphasiastrum complanatum]|uniref:Uncharacterized protein n=1 Tax=Diphasiastrum complanatum TaxID=34168 RepID=A0ACC2DPW5_DIPCM|nr:hypothetical protein O6H91_Y301600 [Diphasiastrum complanatum]KAJ7299116.1 hypothetical protein O6H91_Y301600 [Diphasiastrum complanatum]KAJ7556263.1 hypothetical protein O6H91_05G076400 [Diphasiastrum complanatum]